MGYEPMRPINLPLGELLDLELHLMNVRPGVKLETFITELLQRWLTIDKERLALRTNGPAIRGFQWKNIFLPEGTNLRTSHRGNVEFAKVVGDHIISDDGISLTPSLFANRRTGGRNAWRFVWLRFPGNDYWIRAADCRTRFEDQRQQRSASKIETL
ncbi:hypothetical protein GCM10027277_56060 [Pseudoduganella ginsengisoli]|uniref:Uncharacterized protein n=1 Tax=Pseudoduganella ginsengisoli TaxID=1462440 RepID=A0A6L6Q6U5_9BURK|nr:hypothetical protein [Pseudoduganella ginsengisoli]MTW05169.1 hypothetical protein [Pseudoduganella ginsengisoli]